MTKTQWIVIGVGVTVGFIALLIWKKNDDEQVKKEKDEVLKQLKPLFDKKK
jgi:hypothetical protein